MSKIGNFVGRFAKPSYKVTDLGRQYSLTETSPQVFFSLAPICASTMGLARYLKLSKKPVTTCNLFRLRGGLVSGRMDFIMALANSDTDQLIEQASQGDGSARQQLLGR